MISHVAGIHDNMDCSLPEHSRSGEVFDPRRHISSGSGDFCRSVQKLPDHLGKSGNCEGHHRYHWIFFSRMVLHWRYHWLHPHRLRRLWRPRRSHLALQWLQEKQILPGSSYRKYNSLLLDHSSFNSKLRPTENVLQTIRIASNTHLNFEKKHDLIIDHSIL